MSELARLQGDFQEYLLRGSSAIEQAVAGSARVPVATRLGIYAGAYGARLIDALKASYPVLAELLGEEDFAALGAAYVRAHDSPFFSIRHYGDALEAFLGEYPDTAEVALLGELARWEWTLCAVFDAADAEPLAAAAFARIAPGEWAALRLRFHPSVRRLALEWNVPQLWKALTEGAERPQLRVVSKPVAWLLWRQDLKSYFRSLEPAEAAALDLARAGATFGELCERLAAVHGAGRAPGEAATLLAGWVAAGLLVAAAPG